MTYDQEAAELLDRRSFQAALIAFVAVCKNEPYEGEDVQQSLAEFLEYIDGARKPKGEIIKTEINGRPYLVDTGHKGDPGIIYPQGQGLQALGLPSSMLAPKENADIPKEFKKRLEGKPKRGRPKGSTNKAKAKAPQLSAKQIKAAKKRKPLDDDKPLTAAEIKQIREEDAANKPNPQAILKKAIQEVIKPNFFQAIPSASGYKIFNVNMERDGASVPTSGWQEALQEAGIPFQDVQFKVLKASLSANGANVDQAQGPNMLQVMIG